MGKKSFLIAVAVASISFTGCGSGKSTPDTQAIESAVADSTAAQDQSTEAASPLTEATDDAGTEAAVDTSAATSADTSGGPGAALDIITPGTEALAVTDVETPPGVSNDKFVGAASDVKTESCARVDTGWTASGTVTNSSGAAANYRIYVAFNRKGTTDTRALVQTNVSVPDGATQPWKAEAASTDTDLFCILRVERTA